MTKIKPYRIVIAEDHSLFRNVVKRFIEDVPGLQVVGTAGDGLELLQVLQKSRADMVILNIVRPDLQGLEFAQQIRKLYPGLKILILTIYKTKEYLVRVLEAGADGYLVKENAYTDLIDAIDTLRRGRSYISSLISNLMASFIRQRGRLQGDPAPSEILTPREKQVLRFIAEGKTSREIAALLAIAPLTVNHHRRNIMKKLNLKRNVNLVKYAIQFGYVTMPSQ